MFCYIFLLIFFQTVHTTLTKDIGGRIIGGKQARAGQFPFAAAILVQTDNSQHFCGGSLLTQKHILTAGYCVDGGEVFTIQLGSTTLEGEDNYRTIVSTNDFVLHPKYNPSTFESNLGIIILRMNITLIVGYIWPVNYLPEEEIQESETAISIGWGQVSDETPGPENDLYYVELTALSNAECKITYGDQITDNMVCAEGNYNEGTCIGDIGGPLVQNVRIGQMKQVAIASFISGNGCESTDPSGFTRLYPHLEWIKDVTGRN